jgi:hypothetical protein
LSDSLGLMQTMRKLIQTRFNKESNEY